MKLTVASILLAISSVAVAQSGVWTLGSNCPKSTQTTCGSGGKEFVIVYPLLYDGWLIIWRLAATSRFGSAPEILLNGNSRLLVPLAWLAKTTMKRTGLGASSVEVWAPHC
jgi:hypothetical protein